MADEMEKTEEPTPKKLQKARSEGNVPKSIEVVALVSLLVAFVVLFASFWYMTNGIIALYMYLNSFMGQELTKNTVLEIIIVSSYKSALILAPLAISLIVAGVVGNISQFGFLLTSKVFKLNFSKVLNPIPGIKNLFSLQKATQAAIVTAKVTVALVAGGVAYFYFFTDIEELVLLEFGEQLLWFKEKVMILISVLMLVFFIIAAIDLVVKRYQYFKSLRMSKQEVKDEHKQQEGDPLVRRKIRQKMFEVMGRRMMQNVPSADVVVTNPTHYAVALRYDQTKDRAPVVVAKGINRVALKIKEIAREHLIQIVENPPLARELYKSVEIGEEIPEMLYQAVAELFAYIHKTQKSSMGTR